MFPWPKRTHSNSIAMHRSNLPCRKQRRVSERAFLVVEMEMHADNHRGARQLEKGGGPWLTDRSEGLRLSNREIASPISLFVSKIEFRYETSRCPIIANLPGTVRKSAHLDASWLPGCRAQPGARHPVRLHTTSGLLPSSLPPW